MCKASYQIKWRKSKKLLDAYIERYNADKPLREQLRAPHKALAQHLLFLYSAAIAREQAYGVGIAEMSTLPMLRTNNAQLADAMGCNERSIQNHRKRLKAAKVILEEVFHGSNAQYEVKFNGAIVHLQAAGNPDNVIHLFQQGVNGQNPSPANAPSMQTFRHTVSCKTTQVTKELIELSGVDSQQQTDFQSNEWKKAVEKAVNKCAKPENVVENQQSGSIQDTQGTRAGYENGSAGQETPPELRGTPRSEAELSEVPPHSVGTGKAKSEGGKSATKPSTLTPKLSPHPPQTLSEALKGIDRKIALSISRHIQVIWTTALLNLYDDKWIADEEAERAKAVLAEYFIYTTPDRFQAGAAEIIERITLVRRWIERGQANNEKRWVPLPSKYFNFRNQKGFTRTKTWFKAHIKAKAEIKAKELLTKAIKEYLRAQEPGAKIGPSETYRRISQRLGKYDRWLLDRFHEQIANVNAANVPQATKATA